jgi:chorismate synthase
MASNSFGEIFKFTTWGESHGKAIGVVIDGCPAGLDISEQELNAALQRRSPGASQYTSPRKEPDLAHIYSGIFEGKTTGAPISIIIPNKNADSSKYEPVKNLLKPGHANYTYLQKYGIFDYRGGGRASARETACRVAAGYVANKILAAFNINVSAYIQSIGGIEINQSNQNLDDSEIFCPDKVIESQILELINTVKQQGDSLGGVVEFVVTNIPAGLGDPVYQKLEAKLASAMMSIPATKGFEIGEGFNAAKMQGSTHNDLFSNLDKNNSTITNHAGGTLGGISTGMPLIGKVAFKPASSIKKAQQTLDLDGNIQEFKLPEGSKHDPCVAIRAVPVVEAMCAVVFADALLSNRVVKIFDDA